VGEVIASAAGVVIVAFLALLLSTLSVLRSIGPALAIAVAVTLIAGLTLVPAIVSLLGHRVFWPSRAWQREPKGARFAAIGRALGRRPGLFAAVSGLVLAALAIGAFSYNPTFDLSSAGIPAHAGSQTALKTLEKGLPPGATDPADVRLHTQSGQPLTAADLASYGAKLKTLPGVGAVAPPRVSADRATADYTFASLALAGNSILSQLGFAVSCGIALAAFVMAMFFSPSLTALTGHRAWWPGHADEARAPAAAQPQEAAP
jgi:putative drug exporter of the RND superfamily